MHSFAFWIALACGFLTGGVIAYASTVFNPRPVIAYPTLENAGKITYVDNTGVCYKYEAVEVKCVGDSRTLL